MYGSQITDHRNIQARRDLRTIAQHLLAAGLALSSDQVETFV